MRLPIFKRSGIILRPVAFTGWMLILTGVIYAIWIFTLVDSRSHSISDTLMDFASWVLLILLIYNTIAYLTIILPGFFGKEYLLRDEGCQILELVNTEAEPAYSVARARIMAGAATKKHTLIETTEWYLVLKGRGRLFTGAEAEREVGPGSLTRIPPGVSQFIVNTGKSELVFLVICRPRFTMECYTSDT